MFERNSSVEDARIEGAQDELERRRSERVDIALEMARLGRLSWRWRPMRAGVSGHATMLEFIERGCGVRIEVCSVFEDVEVARVEGGAALGFRYMVFIAPDLVMFFDDELEVWNGDFDPMRHIVECVYPGFRVASDADGRTWHVFHPSGQYVLSIGLGRHLRASDGVGRSTWSGRRRESRPS